MKTIKNGPEAQAGKCHKFLNTYKPDFTMILGNKITWKWELLFL
jgi:hypothetical protein